MKSYAQRVVFSDLQVWLWQRATELVAQLPDPASDSEWRCHEVARAVFQYVHNEPGPYKADLAGTLTVIDGCYGSADHSWIEGITMNVKLGQSRKFILDTYAVHRLPMVQLLDTESWASKNGLQFRPGNARQDVRQDVIERMLRTWNYRGRNGTELSLR